MKISVFALILLLCVCFIGCGETSEIAIFREETVLSVTFIAGDYKYEGTLTLSAWDDSARNYELTISSPGDVEGMVISRLGGRYEVEMGDLSYEGRSRLHEALDMLSPDEYSVTVERGEGYTALVHTEQGEVELIYDFGEETPRKINIYSNGKLYSFNIN